MARSANKLHEIAEVIGWPAVGAMLRHFGGQRLYVPVTLPTDSRIARVLGKQAADNLCAYYHQTELYFPLRWQQELKVRELLSQNPRPTNNAIVEAVGLSYPTVVRMIHRIQAGDTEAANDALPSELTQLSIFDVLNTVPVSSDT